MPIDIDKPIPKVNETLTDLLERIAVANEQLLQVQRPGVHGIEGTEVIPELRINRFMLTENQSYPVGGNRRRSSLTIKVLTGTVELREHTGLYEPGWVMEAGESLTLEFSTNTVYIEAFGGNAEVQTIEESS